MRRTIRPMRPVGRCKARLERRRSQADVVASLTEAAERRGNEREGQQDVLEYSTEMV